MRIRPFTATLPNASMPTVLVFCYYTYDDDSGRQVHCRRAATLDAIERENGIPLRETGIEVDVSQVDSGGFLKGSPSCGDTLRF